MGDSPRCDLCRDTGWVIVPHPLCVSRGLLVCWRGATSIRTCGVACTNRVHDPRTGYVMPCEPGAAAASRGGMTWDRYTQQIGGLDGAELLREYERDKAEHARHKRPANPEWDALYARLTARVREQQAAEAA